MGHQEDYFSKISLNKELQTAFYFKLKNLSIKSVEDIARRGRARWKIENETFNTLKNNGYNFEHNFGHGYKYLASNFTQLMLIAFLIDQIRIRFCALTECLRDEIQTYKQTWETQKRALCSYRVSSFIELLATALLNRTARRRLKKKPNTAQISLLNQESKL